MKVDRELIEHVAKVARLKLTDEEINDFKVQVAEVLESFSTLDDCDVSGVEPSFQPVALSDHMRDDIVEESVSQDKVLKLSESKEGFFLGPKAV